MDAQIKQTIFGLKGRDYISFTDFSEQETLAVLDFAMELKAMQRTGVPHEFLKNKVLAMYFEKNSTRTRLSFEAGMTHLGGHAMFLSKNDLQLARVETIEDTASAISRYADCIMARLYRHKDALTIAKWAKAPFINGLTDFEHPCQTLADVMTIREKKGKLSGLNVCFVGDAENNVCHSLMLACGMLGMNVSIGCPSAYAPDKNILAQAKKLASKKETRVRVTDDPIQAVKDADVVYADVWVSMGDEEGEKQRIKDLSPYQVNRKLMSHAKKNAIFLHDLPVHRGFEVTNEVIDGPQSVVWDEAENRMHAQKALLVGLIGAKNKT